MKTEDWFRNKLEKFKKDKDFWIDSLILALEERIVAMGSSTK